MRYTPMHINVLGNRQRWRFRMMRHEQLQEFLDRAFPGRTEAPEPRRAKIKNTDICWTTFRQRRVLQRALHVGSRADSKKGKGCVRGLGNLGAMVPKQVQRRSVAHAAEQFVKRAPKGAWRIVPAQRAKRWVELAERGMRQMRFVRIAQFEVMKVAERKVKLAQLGREFGLADLPSREMQPVALYHLVAIDEDTALRGPGAAPAPGVIERAKIGDGGTPFKAAGGAFR